jgi:hypothetical protein
VRKASTLAHNEVRRSNRRLSYIRAGTFREDFAWLIRLALKKGMGTNSKCCRIRYSRYGWQMYISWFTWYFGINFFALAWISDCGKAKARIYRTSRRRHDFRKFDCGRCHMAAGGNSCRSYVAIDLLDLRHHSRLGGFPRTVFSLVQT